MVNSSSKTSRQPVSIAATRPVPRRPDSGNALLTALHIFGDTPVIRFENQVSEIQVWIMSVNVTRQIDKERRKEYVKKRRSLGERKDI